PAFKALAQSPTPETAASLVAAGVANVAKIWTELAFEAVRQQLAPEAPSRLDAIFAFADPIEALSFTETTGQGQQVWRGTVESGVTWWLVDMAAFDVVEPQANAADVFRVSWAVALERARGYWIPEGT